MPFQILARTVETMLVAISSALSASHFEIMVSPYLAATAKLDSMDRSESDAPISHGSSLASERKSCVHSGSMPDAVIAAFIAFSAAC